LPPDLAIRLSAALGNRGAVAVVESDGRLHPVCALWRADAIAALPGYLATGRRSLKGFAGAVGMTVVVWSVAKVDPFANANTPADLDALQPCRDLSVATI